MHILTNEGLRKAEQVEVQCILANLHNDLASHYREVNTSNAEEQFKIGQLCATEWAMGSILFILQAYDDQQFIDDNLQTIFDSEED